MDHKNMSLEDLIKKDRTHRKSGGGGGQRGGRGGFGGFGGRGGRGGRGDAGNLVPRFKKGAGIFKRKQGGGGGGQGELILPPRGGQKFAPRGGAGGEGGPRMRRFRGGAPREGGQQVQRRERLFGPGGQRNRREGLRGPIIGGGAGRPRRLNPNPRSDRPPLRQQRRERVQERAPVQQAQPKPQKQGGKRLKVRNLDENKVSNDDLKTLFEKIGKLLQCKFDRNEFGQFLGSATVVYEKPEDAKSAIDEYHQAMLDNRVLTVEYDISSTVRVPKIRGNTNAPQRGKTLRVGGNRGGAGGRR